jgi:hypothetical protein
LYWVKTSEFVLAANWEKNAEMVVPFLDAVTATDPFGQPEPNSVNCPSL